MKYTHLFLLLSLAWLTNSHATPIKDAELATQLVAANKIQPLSTLLYQLQRHKKGHLLDVRLYLRNQQYIYELFLTDEQGIIWEAELNAKTGELLELHLNELEVHHDEITAD